MINRWIFDIILFPFQLTFCKKKIAADVPNIVADNKLYLQKIQIYSLTGNEKVFSEDYVMPDKIPVDLYDIFEQDSTRTKGLSFERHLRGFEFAFANQSQLQLLSEYKNGLEEKFSVFMRKLSVEYFDNFCHLNPSNLDLTFYLLKFRSVKTRNFILSEMLFNYPINFELEDLKDIYENISIKPTSVNPRALLGIYLAGHFEKYDFFSQIIDAENVEYRSYYQVGNEHENIGDSFLAYVLEAKKQYLGRSLREVIAIEHPELLMGLTEYPGAN